MLGIRVSTNKSVILLEVCCLLFEAYTAEQTVHFVFKSHRIAVNRPDSLHVAALAVQRQIADRGLPCWGRGISLKLDKLSLTNYWVHQPLKLSQCLRNIIKVTIILARIYHYIVT